MSLSCSQCPWNVSPLTSGSSPQRSGSLAPSPALMSLSPPVPLRAITPTPFLALPRPRVLLRAAARGEVDPPELQARPSSAGALEGRRPGRPGLKVEGERGMAGGGRASKMNTTTTRPKRSASVEEKKADDNFFPSPLSKEVILPLSLTLPCLPDGDRPLLAAQLRLRL